MAVRFHVAGARDVTREAFLAAFAELGVQEAECVNGWCWTQIYEAVPNARIDERLEKLPGPGLRTTLEDGRWYLHVAMPGESKFRSCHDFHKLKDLADYNAQANSGAPRDLDQEAWYDHLQEFFVLHAGEIAGAMIRFKIPSNYQSLMASLTGKTVTRGELDSEVGDLPRFLADIGFGPKFESWVAKLSATSPDAEGMHMVKTDVRP